VGLGSHWFLSEQRSGVSIRSTDRRYRTGGFFVSADEFDHLSAALLSYVGGGFE
jgi:hypothetical protein